jgi:SAM-dependent methyltransferase
VKKLRHWTPKGDSRLLYEFLPNDTSRQSHALREAVHVLDRMANNHQSTGPLVLDLGCGSGRSFDVLSARIRNLRWAGLDILDSQEVISRSSRTLPFCSYDGVNLPLADSAVDLVYSQQVFEHVRYPERLIGEVRRVLRDGGVFVGSTSHLEPFHSRSYWNYTPYGFCVLLRDAGFQSIQIRPGIDSLTLIFRRYSNYVKLSRLFEPFFTSESPMNALLEGTLRLLRQSADRRNAIKLSFAGQFCFVARK